MDDPIKLKLFDHVWFDFHVILLYKVFNCLISVLNKYTLNWLDIVPVLQLSSHDDISSTSPKQSLKLDFWYWWFRFISNNVSLMHHFAKQFVLSIYLYSKRSLHHNWPPKAKRYRIIAGSSSASSSCSFHLITFTRAPIPPNSKTTVYCPTWN